MRFNPLDIVRIDGADAAILDPCFQHGFGKSIAESLRLLAYEEVGITRLDNEPFDGIGGKLRKRVIPPCPCDTAEHPVDVPFKLRFAYLRCKLYAFVADGVIGGIHKEHFRYAEAKYAANGAVEPSLCEGVYQIVAVIQMLKRRIEQGGRSADVIRSNVR